MSKKVSVASTKGLSVTDRIRSGYAGVSHLVGLAVKGYKMNAVMMHHAACAVAFHAAQHGDPRPMNDLFKEMRENDKNGFRFWVGKLCTYSFKQEDGSEVSGQWLAYTKKDGFVVKKGTENHRKGTLDLDGIIAGASFMDINQKQEAKALGVAELLALLAKVQKNAEKKAGDNNIKLPQDVVGALEFLTKTVNKVAEFKPNF